MDVGDVPLAAEEIPQLALFVVNRTEMESIPECRTILAVIQQLDDQHFFGAYGIADFRHLRLVGLGAL